MYTRISLYASAAALVASVGAAEEAADLTGDFAFAVVDRDQPETLLGEGTLRLSFDEISLIDLSYGAFFEFDLEYPLNDTGLQANHYGVYFGQNDWGVLFSNDLSVSFVPQTNLQDDRGLVRKWDAAQPIDGDAAYIGAFTDATGEGDVGVLVNYSWDDFDLAFGLGYDEAVELSGILRKELFSLSFAVSNYDHSSYALGAEFAFGTSVLSLAYGTTGALNYTSYGVKLVQSFDTWDFNFGYGNDKAGAATGVRESFSIGTDIFIGSDGLLEFMVGKNTTNSYGTDMQYFASYSHEVGITKIKAGIGNSSADPSGLGFEIGAVITF